MNEKIIGCLLCICLSFACNKEKALTQEQENTELENLALRITGMIDGLVCEDASDWAYIAFGSKACGGPTGYVAYPNSINTTQFLGLVEQYRKAEMAYNEKWGIISDCAITPAPKGVVCTEGKPILVY